MYRLVTSRVRSNSGMSRLVTSRVRPTGVDVQVDDLNDKAKRYDELVVASRVNLT